MKVCVLWLVCLGGPLSATANRSQFSGWQANPACDTSASQRAGAANLVSYTLRKAVNECRQVGSVSQAPLAKVKGCHIYRRHSQWKVSLATTSLEDLSILEGIFSVVIFTDSNEHCNYIKDTGVESVKDAYRTRAVDRGLEASPRRSQQLPAHGELSQSLRALEII